MADPVLPPDADARPQISDLYVSGVTQYFGYVIQKERYRVEGRMQLPIYGVNGVSSVVGRMHAPMERMKIYWIIHSKVGQPILPDPLLFDPNNVFLYGEQGGDSPVLLPSMIAYAWRLWGTYHYAIVAPQGLTEDFKLPVKAYDSIGSGATIPNANFQQGFLDFATDYPTPVVRQNEDISELTSTPPQGP
jgi:hypothetical protein